MRNKLLAAVAGIAAAVALSVTPALAQSSGNAAGSIFIPTTTCSVESSGMLSTSSSTGAVACPGDTSGATDCALLMSTTIQTPSGSGTAIEISPSLDVGLFTDTKIGGNGSKQQSSANAKVMVYVTVDGNLVPPGGVVYDQRYQSLSGVLGDAVTGNGSCLTDSSCVSEYIDLFLTTLSAHTFNLMYPVSGGSHVVNVYYQVTNQTCTNGTIGTCGSASTLNSASADACVGPGTLTVTQVKEYSQN